MGSLLTLAIPPVRESEPGLHIPKDSLPQEQWRPAGSLAPQEVAGQAQVFQSNLVVTEYKVSFCGKIAKKSLEISSTLQEVTEFLDLLSQVFLTVWDNN